PFAGVRYWDRAVRQAQRIAGQSSQPIRKLLVAARTDRGGVPVGGERLAAVVAEIGCDGLFITSAKEGRGIKEVIEAAMAAIDWSKLPKITSNDLLEDVKAALAEQREGGVRLVTEGALWQTFANTQLLDFRTPEENDDLRSQFSICTARLEARGVVRRLTF